MKLSLNERSRRIGPCAVAALLAFFWQCEAKAAETQSKSPPTTGVAMVPAAQTLSIRDPREVAKGGHLMIDARGHPWSQLTLAAQPLKMGNYAAFIRFSKLEGANRAQMDDPRLGCPAASPCPIDFEIVDAKARGTYVGTVELDSIGEHLATATINLLVPEVGPPPSVTSDYLKGNTLDFDATKDNSFFLSVTNGVGSPSRALRVEATPEAWVAVKTLLDRVRNRTPCNVPSVVFSPTSLLLDGGQTGEVRVQVPTCLRAGAYKGVFQVLDVDNGLTVVAKEIRVTRASPETSRRWVLLFWVVVGAALSVALNNAFPLQRARADRFEELARVKAKLIACGSLGSALRGALRSEAQRLWLLIDSVSFVNTRKDAILTEAQQGVQALSQLVAIADSVNSLRAECDGLALPIRTLLIIAEYLREAEEALMRSDVAGAQARVSAATQLVRTDCDAKALAEALTIDIAKLLAERPNGGVAVPVTTTPRDRKTCHKSCNEAVKKGRPLSIAQRVVLLELNRADLDKQPLADLLLLEREFYIAEVWTNIVELAIANASNDAKARLKEMSEPLLTQLEVAPSAAQTQLAILLVKSSLSFTDVEAALASGVAQIICSPYARYLDLETFEFRFLSPVLSAVPAVTQLLDYQWEFDDRTTPPEDGDRCKHFFWAPGRWKRIWWRIRRQPLPDRQVSVRVSIPMMALKATPKTHLFQRHIAMQIQRDRASSLGAIQVITFGITTGMAVLASFGTQYGGLLPASIDWGASVTALLFGFGIDQIRDRAASK